MKVYKFGGASVRDADGIRNLAEIVKKEPGHLVIVVSAFGKTTNALEEVLPLWMDRNHDYIDKINHIYNYHSSVMSGLFPIELDVHDEVRQSFEKLKRYLASGIRNDYDFEYDQIVSMGEVWSTMIVAAYLKTVKENVEWMDIRKYLLTDDRFRDANIIWEESSIRVKSGFNFMKASVYVTQGFTGATENGHSTTLGREGSDYTAAILANMLDAESVFVWKDVPGILNADPKWFEATSKMDEISYREAVEMTFSGAKVIHPKTIKPLHNKNIPLHVKSFLFPDKPGTVIKNEPEIKSTVPVFIRKEDQMLISILPLDFSFVMGDNLGHIINKFMQMGIKVNLVEASAISIDVCVNDERDRIGNFIEDIKSEFSIIYNENVEILTIRHYNEEAISMITKGREILLQQKARNTVRFVVRKKDSETLEPSKG